MVLPEPDSPTMPTRSPGRDGERHAPQGVAHGRGPAQRAGGGGGSRGATSTASRIGVAHAGSLQRVPARHARRPSPPSGGTVSHTSVARGQRVRNTQPDGKWPAAGHGAGDGGQPAPLRRGGTDRWWPPRRRAARPCTGAGAPANTAAVGPGLDDAPAVHHQHPLAQARHDGEVVGDEQQGAALLGHQPVDERQHAGLHGDVERGGRLVADQHGRVAGQCHGQHDPLALAARELVRVGPQGRRRVGQLDARQQLLGAGPRPRPAAGRRCRRSGLGHLAADAHQRVEGRHRLLEHHGQAVAAQRAELRAPTGVSQVAAVEAHRARGRQLLGQQAHDGERGERLARARLADQPDPLARRQRERHVAARSASAPARTRTSSTSSSAAAGLTPAPPAASGRGRRAGRRRGG